MIPRTQRGRPRRAELRGRLRLLDRVAFLTGEDDLPWDVEIPPLFTT